MNPIEQQVAARRKALALAGLPPDAGRVWGLALSGGGIRSATFCFGLLRALARRQLLLRFDLISTVSGGGYIGATLGRLFSRAASAADVRAIADAFSTGSTRWFAWWLRANGRYLIPRGAKDRTFAIGLYLRNLAAIHFELGILAILLGAGLATIDIGGWSLLARFGYTEPDAVFTAARYLPTWLPVIAFALPPVALVAGVIAIAYWCVPWLVRTGRISPLSVVPHWLAMAALAGGLWWSLPLLESVHTDVGETARLLLWGTALTLATAWLVAVPTSALVLWRTGSTLPTPSRADFSRTRLTGWLAVCLRTAVVLAVAGLVDRFAWYLAFEFGGLGEAGLALALAAAATRVILPALSSLMPGRSSTSALLWLGRFAGYALTFLLCAWWVSIVYVAALGAAFQRAGPNFGEGLAIAATLGAAAIAYLVITGRNIAFLNLSSLHPFYRSRLARSYLGAANGERFGLPRGIDAITELPEPMTSPAMVAVGDPQPDDDVALADYLPQRHGGPVHLINCCVNQTRDPRGGLFNQDRRGLALTVASGGHLQISQRGWQRLDESTPSTLGTWTAVSGAAVAPGLGAMTRGGISALATFAGLRLGFWWDQKARTRLGAGRWSAFAKSSGLIREALGIFRGTDRPDWFLTDGGHFENTGAYALLAERAEVIVLADCGADPRYAFCDVENLVRKARIDLQAEILFQRPRQRPAASSRTPTPADARYRLAKPAPADDGWPIVMDDFGSLNDLASPNSSACLALARIRYLGARSGDGVLILVKPNVSSGLPVDLVNFKAENPEFPQQTTADQFFSEAQWESYSQLGYFLGGKLEREFIDAVVDRDCPWFMADEVSPFDRAKADKRQAEAASASSALARLPARIGATAVTGIGLGAAATIGVSTWQAIDSVRSSYTKQTSDERAALKELTDLWAKVAPAAPPSLQESKENVQAIGSLAAAIVRSADTLCPAHEEGWFQASPVAGSIYNTALGECGRLAADARPVACTVLLEAAHPSLQRPLPDCLVRIEGPSKAVPPPRYWVYDYAGDAPYARAHPCDPVAASRRVAEDDYQTGKLRLERPADVSTANGQMAAECRRPGASSDPAVTGPATAAPAALPRPPEPSASAPIAAATVAVAPLPAASSAAPDWRPASAAPAKSPASGAAASGAAVVASARPAPPAGICNGRTVYTQIYGAAQRDAVRDYREAWRRLGASVPPIEDVYASARSAGRGQPLAVAGTTVRYHDEPSRSCALALTSAPGAAAWRVEPLSPRLKAVPGVIEVWVAPSQR